MCAAVGFCTLALCVVVWVVNGSCKRVRGGGRTWWVSSSSERCVVGSTSESRTTHACDDDGLIDHASRTTVSEGGRPSNLPQSNSSTHDRSRLLCVYTPECCGTLIALLSSAKAPALRCGTYRLAATTPLPTLSDRVDIGARDAATPCATPLFSEPFDRLPTTGAWRDLSAYPPATTIPRFYALQGNSQQVDRAW